MWRYIGSFLVVAFFVGAAASDDFDYEAMAQELEGLADQGDAQAMLFLGGLYEQGAGVPQSYENAMHWYKASIDAGSKVTSPIGHLYKNGAGVRQDYQKAARWYWKGINSGALPPPELGTLYAHGKGVSEDSVVAYAIFQLLWLQGHRYEALGERDSIAAQMTQEEIEDAKGYASACASSVRSNEACDWSWASRE